MKASVLLNLLLMYGILIGVNLPAPLLGLNFEDGDARERLWYEPPGYVIPVAWFVLFALLAVARSELTRIDPAGAGGWLVVGLAVLCATYAYYTLGFASLTGISALWFGLAGNLAVILVAAVVAYKISATSVTAASLVVPVVVWTAYATAIVVGEMKVQRLI